MSNDLPDQVAFWDEWHRKINERVPDWGIHFPFAEEVVSLFPSPELGPILDLGCGQCNDAIYFADFGFEVYGLDFSSVGLDKGRSTLDTRNVSSVYLRLYDISSPLPFPDRTFVAVYSHLSLHYFDENTTRAVFNEIWRVLKPEGVLAFKVKSVHDGRYGEGIELGPDIYNYKNHIRHFFSCEYTHELLSDWHVIFLEECEAFYGGGAEVSAFIKAAAFKPKHD